MPNNLKTLAVGATGSIGRHVVEEALRRGHALRALVRNAASPVPRGAETALGDFTRPDTLSAAVEGIDAIIFTHGSDGGRKVPKPWIMAAFAISSRRLRAGKRALRS